MTADKVTVLLSTYNGEQFLLQQLASLYVQTYPNIKILVRDDGSQDNTPALLADEQARGAIELLSDSQGNLGATGSFFCLLQTAAQTNTAYVAFCDQDDVWQANKIEQAVSLLANLTDRPALYCSRLSVVDQDLKQLYLTLIPDKIGFGNALVENIAVGCTMVLNRKAIDLLCSQRLPKEVYIHDWWCYLVIACFGDVVFDDRPLIQYRQHGGNIIGATASYWVALKRKFARLISGRLWISEEAVVLHNLFGDTMPNEQRALLELLLKSKSSFWHRVHLALSNKVWRQKFIDNVILRFVILLNRI